MSCVHRFVSDDPRCLNCDADAIQILTVAIAGMDAGMRTALGYLVNGQRADAEKTLRDALAASFPFTTNEHQQQLTLDSVEAP